MRAAFWWSALFIAYVYVGYPVLLAVWARLHRRLRRPGDPGWRERESGARARRNVSAPARAPRVSILVAARNEARRLPARVQNLLTLNYPADRREVIVVSDGSTDHTEAALAPFGDAIRLVTIRPSGKALALNAGVAQATGDILVFADARQSFAADALRALVAPFADPGVGGVSGELVLGSEPDGGRRSRRNRRSGHPAGRRRPGSRGTAGDFERRDHQRRVSERRADGRSAVGDGVGFYWRYEKRLRRLESEVGSMLGATGAIYALRRGLWRPLPPGTILDDVLAPMRAVLAGSRVVFEPAAQAFDRTAPDARSESRRKIRTLAGNVQILWFEPRLLLPVANPVWLQYTSHKVFRLLVPYALMALFASSITLAETGPLYAAALFGQCAFYLQGGYGAWLEHWQQVGPPSPSLVQRAGKVAFTIAVMNVSAVAGVGAAIFGRKVWR